MIVFMHNATMHFAATLPYKIGACVIKRFSDKEVYVKVEEDVAGKTVWVLGATFAPADMILELIFLLDALQRSGATINLLFTYFGYARQDRPTPGEAFSAQVICNIFKLFKLNKIVIIQPHSAALHKLLPFEAVIPVELFYPVADNYDIIVAPDKGAAEWVEPIAKTCNKEFLQGSKQRFGLDQTRFLGLQNNVRDKKILIIDDVISTGGTLLNLVYGLEQRGARSISALATHGIFAGDAHERLINSNLDKIYVTNTIPQQENEKIVTLDVSPLIQKVIGLT